MSNPVALADALVAEILTLPGLPSGADVARAWVDEVDLKTAGPFRVRVFVASQAQESIGRNVVREEPKLEIVFNMKLSATDPAAVDPLVAFVNSVRVHFKPFTRPAQAPTAMVMEVDWPIVALADHLYNLRLFTSVLTFGFRDPC